MVSVNCHVIGVGKESVGERGMQWEWGGKRWDLLGWGGVWFEEREGRKG